MGTDTLTDKINRTKVREYTVEAVLAVCLVGAGIAILGGVLLLLAGAIPVVTDTIPEVIEFITLAVNGEKTPDELVNGGLWAIFAGIWMFIIALLIVGAYEMIFE